MRGKCLMVFIYIVSIGRVPGNRHKWREARRHDFAARS